MFLSPTVPRRLAEVSESLGQSLGCLEPAYFKSIPFKRAIATFPQPAVELLTQMMQWAEGKHKSVRVDLKVYDLKAGDYTCIPGWHIDTVTNPRHDSRPENHLIYTNVYGTDFVSTPIAFSEEKTHFSQVIAEIPEDNYLTATPNSIYQYGRFHLHRGAQVTTDCRRVLVRITETDIIR